MRHRDLLRLRRPASGARSGAGRDHLAADAVALRRLDDRVGGDLAGRASGPPARTARGGSRPAPRRGSCAAGLEAPRRSPRGRRRTRRPCRRTRRAWSSGRTGSRRGRGERLDVRDATRPARAAGTARRARPAARASRPCPGRAPARRVRAGRRASASSACRWSVGHVLVVEGDHLAALGRPRAACRGRCSRRRAWSGITCAALTPGASASSRSGIPSAAAGSAIIRASWPPPMTATVGASARSHGVPYRGVVSSLSGAERTTYVLIDGANIDATLGASIIGRRPLPSEPSPLGARSSPSRSPPAGNRRRAVLPRRPGRCR